MIEWAVTSSVLILVVLALRRCLMGKISPRLQYGLWALVLLRLLLPVSLGATAVSILNLVEGANISNPVVGYMGGNTIQLSISEPDPTLPLEEQQEQYEKNLDQWQGEMDADRAENGTPISLGTVLLGLWAAGALCLGLWLLWVNARFAHKLRRGRRPLAADCPLPVYVTGAVQTPCLFGLLHPCIYVTEEAAANETVLRHSLAHELTHCRHRDHIWAALRGLCLALHWYNPLVWLAAVLSQRDGELCCDEATVKGLGEGERAAYGRTLLAVTCQGHGNPLLTATSMTGSGIRERIVLLARHPKTAAYTLAAVVLIAAAAVGCTFTGAQKGADNLSVTLAEGIEVPQAVADYAREYVGEQLTFYTEKEGYEITKAEIIGLTLINTGTAAENSGMNMYRLEYRLKAAHSEEVVLAGGMTMEGGAITEWGSAGQPYLLLHWENSGEATHWEPICVISDLTIAEEYSTPEMLEEYGDAYTAAAMELYRYRVPQPNVLTSADLDRDGEDEEIWLEEQPGDYYELVVKEQDGTELYREGAGTAHVGWNSLYLYSDSQGQVSLLRYNPYASTGFASYSYTLFTLEGGTQTVIQEGNLDFEVRQASERAEELIAFADEINTLLRRSSLLLSTQNGEVTVGPLEAGNNLEDLGDLQQYWSAAPWTPGPNDASLPEEPIELLFSSGAGGWGTTLTLSPDGSFTGEYSDAEMGGTPPTWYVCTFYGEFTNIQQTSPHTWSLTLANLKTDRPTEEVWTEQGSQYISTEAFGVVGGTDFILYAPGTSVYALTSSCRDWWPELYLWRAGEKSTLDGWCLYNVSTGEGFFQW